MARRLLGLPGLVYLGGPIDFHPGRDPDARHVVAQAQFDRYRISDDVLIFCPYCHALKTGNDAETQIAANTVQLTVADWALFVWEVDTQPSIGTPIEMYQRAAIGRSSILVTNGQFGLSMFGRWLVARGVRVVSSVQAAVAVIAESREGTA